MKSRFLKLDSDTLFLPVLGSQCGRAVAGTDAHFVRVSTLVLIQSGV